jgi:drug/metabolite transporter (DMT)-like permease
MRKAHPLVLLNYLVVYVVWGSTYFFIKMAVETIPPYLMLGTRFTVGGFLLLAFAFATGRLRRRPTLRQVLASVLLGSLLLLAGNGMITVAERRIASYIAALLSSSAPIAVALFDRVLLGKRLTPVRLLGIILGCAGVALVLHRGGAISAELDLFLLLGILGAVSFALGTSLGHRFPVYPDALANSGIQMLFAGIVAVAASVLGGVRIPEVFSQVSMRSLFGVSYLAVVGSLAFASYTFLVNHEPAERVVSYALVNPLIALGLGLLLGSETPGPFLPFGAAAILLGLAVMLYGEGLLGRLTAPGGPGSSCR